MTISTRHGFYPACLASLALLGVKAAFVPAMPSWIVLAPVALYAAFWALMFIGLWVFVAVLMFEDRP
jgi:hypothetical protein